jgi:hypothetical protein
MIPESHCKPLIVTNMIRDQFGETRCVQNGAKRLQLLADKNNSPALEFYEKMNWKRTQMIWLWKK